MLNFEETSNKVKLSRPTKKQIVNSNNAISKANTNTINEHDGYYAYISSLSKNQIASIMNILYGKSQALELFKVIKNEYYSRQDISPLDSINAHLLTSFLALQCFKLLEDKLRYKY